MNIGQEFALEARGVSKSFGTHKVLDGIDLTVKAGEVTAILGPNGAGKTTFMRMATTLSQPDEGSIRVFGHDTVLEPKQVRHMIGVVGQAVCIDDELTARQNLMMFCRLEGMNGDEARDRTKRLLHEFSLSDAADRLAGDFSGGMRRRLDLAIGLVGNPPLLFLDEPTTGLDPRTRSQLWETLQELAAGGVALVLTTQYLDEAERLADHVVIIDKGKVVATGTPAELERRIDGIELAVTLTEQEDIPLALRVIERMGDAAARMTGGTRLDIAIPDTAHVQTVLASLADADITVADVEIRKPTMDDVFLTATDGNERDDDDADVSGGRTGERPDRGNGTRPGRGPQGRGGTRPRR